jgi:hypothetical protein
MLDFSTIFNQEIISTPFLEGIKSTIIICIECLKMPIFPLDDNNYIPLWIPLVASMIIPAISKKIKRCF